MLLINKFSSAHKRRFLITINKAYIKQGIDELIFNSLKFHSIDLLPFYKFRAHRNTPRIPVIQIIHLIQTISEKKQFLLFFFRQTLNALYLYIHI